MPSRPLSRGDIVLAPFPFTDLSSKKVRPAVIVSPDPQETDLLIAFVSSVIPSAGPGPCDFLLDASHPDFTGTGLRRTSLFRMKKLLAIQRNRIRRRIGRVSTSIQRELDLRLRRAVGLSD